MIRFVDINTGNLYSGEAPYIHWFPNAQSVNINYSLPICVISYMPELRVSIPDNNIFKIIDVNRLDNLNKENIDNQDFFILSELISNNAISIGSEIAVNGKVLYIHNIYLYTLSKLAGEFIEEFTIENTKCLVGADFYDEDETLTITLANKGVEIPKFIQKAVYCSNIHESSPDAILLNRKWKELLSNAVDIFDNRGSYKSFINSIKWFEYGDLIKIQELWKRHSKWGDVYEVRETQELLNNRFNSTAQKLQKTTYIAISSCIKQIAKDEDRTMYDENMNPLLEQYSYKWSLTDMMIKLGLLGNFYQAYFAPIYMKLYYSVLEDIVFADTFKLKTLPLSKRTDIQYYTKDIKCSVKNGDVFNLTNVSCQVGPDTIFGYQCENYNDAWRNLGKTPNYNEIDIIGVDYVGNVDMIKTDNEAMTFYSQLYNGPGCIIPFVIEIPAYNDDYIKRSVIHFTNKENGDFQSYVDTHIIDERNEKNEILVKFNLLCKYDMEYDVRLQFDTIMGNTYTKKVKFKVKDPDGMRLRIYKFVKKSKEERHQVTNPFESKNDWIFRNQPLDDETKINYMYLPTSLNSLNHMMVIEGEWNDVDYITGLFNKNETTYTWAVRKAFGKADLYDNPPTNTYRNAYVFCPGFYNIELFGGSNYSDKKNMSMSDFTLREKDIICFKADYKFSHRIESPTWELVNNSFSAGKSYALPPTNEPYLIHDSDNMLKSGVYDVIFRCNLSGKPMEIKLKHAFIYENLRPESGG